MAGAEYLGAGGRLAGGPAEELVAAGYAREIAHGPRLAHALSQADMAHAVALAESGSLPAEDAAPLCRGLLELDAIDPAEFPWRPELGDAFNSREAELTARVGRRAAGWLSAGRPRREAFRVALRLVAREGVVELHDALEALAAALVRKATATADALAADYTYLQPAQPTTAGHLLLAYVEPALRDARRLRAVHAELERSVAGAGGSAGSRWPVSRERLAQLLGCQGLVVHAKDAAWQADVYLELLSAMAVAATHLSQLGQDLEIYASREFGLVQLADSHSRASALMPQKRNPYALAVIRTQAGQAAGDLAAALATLHTGSARTDHFHLLNGLVPRALEEAAAVARLAAAVADGLELDLERMARVAREGFVASADVADVLALEGGLDYRSAHKVVGRAVRDLDEAGAPPIAMTPDVLAEAAQEVLGHPVDLPAESVAAALDPAVDIRHRPQPGSCAPEAMAAMLTTAEEALSEGGQWSAAARARSAAAEQALLGRAREIAAV